MRPTAPESSHNPQQGFTLVEMIVVITIVSILMGVVAIFIRHPMQGAIDTANRATLADSADTALRRMRRDLQRAIPNSVRVTSSAGVQYIEFVPSLGGGRYCAEAATSPTCDLLDFTAADSSFDVLGPSISFTAGTSVVVYNLGIPGSSVYEGSNRSAISGISGQTISLSSAFQFPLSSPGNRFQIAGTPVTYVCNPGTGTLVRASGYGWNSNQSTILTGASNAILANTVSNCSVNYNQAAIDRNGLLYMTLGLTKNNESVTLTHAIQINNTP